MSKFWLRGFVVCFVLAVPSIAPAVEDQAVDDAVANALKYLAQQQRHNGCWNVEVMGESTGITSLAVMALLAAGHVPGEGPYGQVIDRGVAYVLEKQDVTGMIVDQRGHGPMYDHGISTLMLSEVAGMTSKEKSARTRHVLENAIKLILKSQMVKKPQREAGGWRYQATSGDSDLSVTGWQLLALRAAKDIGCDVPVENIDLAVDYVKRCKQPSGFGYQPGLGPLSSLTGVGVLALQICGHHDDPAVESGVEFLRRQPLRTDEQWFFYGAYYHAFSGYKYGGPDWEVTKERLFSQLLPLQSPLGQWESRNQNEKRFGPIYTTSLAVLALTVEYGYLPIYQR